MKRGAGMTRHYGMDWLRIGAFGLLILYHVGMFFVHWDWHVKTAVPVEAAAIPMLALSPWRLPLLFVVSGFATRAILQRTHEMGEFTRERTARLMLPVLFAAVIIIPPQPWVELMGKHGYAAAYLHFWTRDYFSFGPIEGLIVPTWQHLWFVVYLWVYTLALVALRPLGRRLGLQAVFDRLCSGAGALLVPVVWFVLARGLLVGGADSTHALVDDWPSHIIYLPAFLFGFALARSEPVWAGIRRWWRSAALLAVVAFLPIAATEIVYPGETPFPDEYRLPYFCIRAVQGGAAVIALIGIADRFWNRDHPLRATLTEAVFPFYIVHQTIIVVTGWWLLRYGLPPLAEFLILVATTTVGCLLFYGVGRRLAWLRPLIGLRRNGAARPPRPEAAPAA